MANYPHDSLNSLDSLDSLESQNTSQNLQLAHKKIILGVSGGIASYKAAELASLLIKSNAQVRVVLTHGAQQFIQALTFQAITHEKVYTELLDPEAEAGMGHIELARWADLIVIAPATAHIIAKIRAGLADDLLSTLCLATTAPVVLAPAMNQAMYLNAITQNNIQHLIANGINCIDPDFGQQACGDIGPGRLPQPEDLMALLEGHFATNELSQYHFLITAGPTQESIDSVRFLTNKSSGKMGIALAKAAYLAGAQVTLVIGPTSVPMPKMPDLSRWQVQPVISAQAMLAACENAGKYDVFIGCAAVADLRPAQTSTTKLKKNDINKTLILEENQDIIATLSQANPNAWHVGFAAETHNIEAYAKQKILNKNLNMIIANDVSDSAIGFQSDANKVLVFHKQTLDTQSGVSIGPCSKALLGRTIIQLIAHNLTSPL